jgi:hypothetical protein
MEEPQGNKAEGELLGKHSDSFGDLPAEVTPTMRDDQPTIVQRMECIRDKTGIKYIRWLQLGFLVSLTILIMESVWVQVSFQVDDAREKILIINLVFGIIGLFIMCFYGVWVHRDVSLQKKQNLIASKRRQRILYLAMVDFYIFLGQLLIFIATDITLLAIMCAWIYSSIQILSFLKWTLFNGLVANQFLHVLSLLPKESIVQIVRSFRLSKWVEKKRILIGAGIDLPSSVYATVFFFFFTVPELCLLLALLYSSGAVAGTWCTRSNQGKCLSEMYLTTCDPWETSCSANSGDGREAMLVAVSVILVFNMALYMVGILWASKVLQNLPYLEYRTMHMQLGYQIMTRFYLTALGILNFVFLWLIETSSCPVTFMSSAGFGSLVFAICITLSVSLWMQALHIPSKKEAAQLFEQDQILWKEPEHADSSNTQCCYQTMLKSFIFSYMVYDIDEMPDDKVLFDIEEFKDIYEFSSHRVIWNKAQDSKCLITWDSDSGKILMAFRGTASAKNVLTDLKIWRSPHPPLRGNYWMGTQPMVHTGFTEFFYESGLKSECLSQIDSIIKSSEEVRHWDILICGHSLGGAAAKLAAYAITSSLKSKHVDFHMKCYSYGAPRCGNSAFAADYNDVVPHTWNVMHLEDVVTKGGKFVYMYKREGRSIFLTKYGSIIRPTYMERITLRGIKTSINQHLLPTYAASLIRMVAQENWDSAKLQRTYKVLASAFTGQLRHHHHHDFDEDHDIDIVTGGSCSDTHATLHRASLRIAENKRTKDSATNWTYKQLFPTLWKNL